MENQRMDEADTFFNDALAEAQSANDRAEVGTTLHNLAAVRFAQHRTPEAEKLWRQSLATLLSANRAEDIPEIIVIERDLGLACALQGRPEEGLVLVDSAITRAQTVFSAHDPHIIELQRKRAALLLANGRPGDAAAAATRATELESATTPAGR